MRGPLERAHHKREMGQRDKATLVSFKDFTHHVGNDDIRAAGRSLGVLFDLADDIAERAAAHFARCWREDPNIIERTMALRQAIDRSSDVEFSSAMNDCFGLDVGHAGQIFARLHARRHKQVN